MNENTDTGTETSRASRPAADLTEFRLTVVEPALDLIQEIGGPRRTKAATRLLLAIARQEGGPGLARYQMLDGGRKGPARGVWQFELGGGVAGVLGHSSSAKAAQALAVARGVRLNSREIWAALEQDDILACGFARLLLLTDPDPLPTRSDTAWAYYLRTWRPGKPRPKHWAENWRAAGEVL